MKRAAWVLAGFAVAAVVGLYLWVRPAPAPPAATPAATPATPAAAAPATADFEFDIAEGRVRGPLALSAREGQRVRLRVRSDVPDELHLHGYELSAPLPAGEWVALTFVAARAGRFEIELHGAHRELGALEVQPR